MSDKSKIIHFVNCLNPNFRDKMFHLLNEIDASSLSLEDVIDVAKGEAILWAGSDTAEADRRGNRIGGLAEKNNGAKGMDESVVMEEMGKAKIKKEDKQSVMGFSGNAPRQLDESGSMRTDMG